MSVDALANIASVDEAGEEFAGGGCEEHETESHRCRHVRFRRRLPRQGRCTARSRLATDTGEPNSSQIATSVPHTNQRNTHRAPWQVIGTTRRTRSPRVYTSPPHACTSHVPPMHVPPMYLSSVTRPLPLSSNAPSYAEA